MANIVLSVIDNWNCSVQKQIIGSNRPSGQPIASKKGEGRGGGGSHQRSEEPI